MLVKWVFRVIRDYLIPIAFGGIIGGLLVGAFFVWPTVYGAKWWEVFAAFGTVGAVIVALFTVWVKRVSQNKIELKNVSLIASGMAGYLDELLIDLKRANAHLDKIIEKYDPEEVGNYSRVLAILDLSHPGLQEMNMLNAVDSIGEQLYLGITCAKIAKSSFDTRAYLLERDFVTLEEKSFLLKRWSYQLGHAIENIEKAKDKCSQYAQFQVLH